MDKEQQNDSNQPLDDSQRIELLENARKFDRLVLMALGGVLLVILASWLTYAARQLTSHEDTVSSKAFSALQQQVADLDRQLAAAKQQLAEQHSEARNATVMEPAPDMDDPAVTRQVAKTLIGQERNFQQSLAALKLGMRDLADMIPGSRSWLGFYQESLDVPLGESRARMKALQAWAGSLPAADATADEPAAATPANTRPAP